MMRRTPARGWTLSILIALAGHPPALALDTSDTSFLHEPAVGGGRIVFAYADDLWTARLDGQDVRRLTSHPGPESGPYISPDGRLVAFTATYDGNPDAYVVPIEGGEPIRLTWHPGPDSVVGFMPEGQVLFRSPRSVFSNRYSQFFQVGPKGGAPTALPIPNGFRAACSPDGRYIAYTPLNEPFRQWKNYRGGSASRIFVLRLADLGVDVIPQPEGRCNDTYPMWVGDSVYFLSDRAGEFNLFSYDRASKSIEQLTRHDDFPVEAASSDGRAVVYEQAGRIWLFDPRDRSDQRLRIGVAADLVETRPRLAGGAKFARSADISPTGQRAVVEFRGEVLTVPARKGDVRNLTRSTGAHERSPIWSPDGKQVAYFSDAPGEYTLRVAPQDGKGEAKSYPLNGAGFYERPWWSPDGKKIAYVDNSRTLAFIDLGSGLVSRIASEAVYGPVNAMASAWSPDSKWIAYTLTNKAKFQALWLYSLDQGRSHSLTDGLAEVAEPAFDASGKYLYFLASTDAGPVKNWFDQSNADIQATHSVFLAVLARATPNPLIRPNDEEPEKAGDKPKEADKDKKDDAKATVIDLEGIESRVIALPIPSGNLANLEAGEEGKICYVRRVGMIPGKAGDAFAGTPSLVRFDLKAREEETLAEKVDDFRISRDRKKLLYHSKETWGIADVGKFAVGKDALPIGVDLRQGRPPCRVGADLPRGLADQPRLLLRQGDARGRLAGDPGEVRKAPPRGAHPVRLEPPDPGDVQRAGRRPQLPQRRRPAPRAQAGADRPAWRRLRGGRGALSVQEGVRRAQLGPRPEGAAGGTRRGGEGRRVPPGGRRRGGHPESRGLRGVRGQGRQAGRAEGRAQGRRDRFAGRGRRADRRRVGPPEPRLGRGEPPEGPRSDRRAGGLRLCAQHRRPRPRLLQEVLLPAGR